jgi:hypothetical protein
MPAPLHLKRNRDQRIDIAECADVGKNNAQEKALTASDSRRYEGNALAQMAPRTQKQFPPSPIVLV